MCPLCGRKIKRGEAVLDHDHTRGNTRCVLHRNCNSIEGRILNWARRACRSDPMLFLGNLIRYWSQDYSHNPVHPAHKNEKQKEILKIKRKLRTLKSERVKQKYRDRIKELQEEDN